ncbi:LTA synthase family protein [Bianquea renquensis]|uniref:Sulfatase-like hydrolase/transferase n=1 Tax=Bianquea renquensis TaxID=2763661 RepID=A0A926I376_9FIRM|nr:LTA synthase family protein [Bianquea renquensis]MBC8545060.1 sulfatase-like hydrolase/transferase [Bianquea renquensis]
MKRKNLLWACVLTALFIFKFTVFYVSADLPLIGIGYPFTMVFFGMLAYCIFSARKSSARKKWVQYLLLDAVVSIVMFIDLYYNTYYDQLPVLGLLSLISMMQKMQGGTVEELFDISFLLMVADLPLILALLIKKVDFSIPKVRWMPIVSVSLSGLLLFSIFTNTQWDIPTAMQHSELFTYHARDVKNFLTGYKTVEAQEVLADGRVAEYVQTSIQKSPYHGIAKERNLILVQMESIQDFVIGASYNGQEIAPNLTALLGNDTIYFDHYYQQIGKGGTSDAEFASLNSLLPVMYGQSYTLFQDDSFYGLPWLLRDQGYETAAMHGYIADFWNRNQAYPVQGFQHFYSEKDYTLTRENKVGWSIGDEDFFQQSISYMKQLSKPFFSFLITLTSHCPYDITEMYNGITLAPEHQDTWFGNYLNSVHYTDAAIGKFIETLKKEGLYEDSILVFYGDHFGLMSSEPECNALMSEFLGYKYDYDQMMNIPLLIHIPGSGVSLTRSVAGGQIDLMPTLLDLMGYSDHVRMALGSNLLTKESGFVASQAYMLKGSFFTDEVAFEMARDGIFENSRAWNTKTHEEIQDLEPFRWLSEESAKLADFSAALLKENVLAQFTDAK